MSNFRGMDMNEPVYALLIQGTFNPPARPRDGRDRPQRTKPIASMLLIVNADTGQITGSRRAIEGLTPPDLSLVGPVTVDATATTALDGWRPADRREKLQGNA